MSKRCLVDTNVIVRYLVQDDEKLAQAATRLFEACDRGDVELIILAAVLAECVFVLQSFYKHGRGKIAETLGQLIASLGIRMEKLDVHAGALRRYRSTKIHFVDCVIAATAALDQTQIASFDKDFENFSDVEVRPQ